MAIILFTEWLNEWKDVFGFDKDKLVAKKADFNDDPIDRFNIERLIQILSNQPFGALEGREIFVNECQWGHDLGALRVKIRPDMHVEVARQGKDFSGEVVWGTKRLFLINRDGYGGHEETVAAKLREQIESVTTQNLDYPKRNYDQLERLTSSMASKMRKTARDYFIFEGIRKVTNNWYIIRFGVRGHGVEAPDQSRVIENQTMLFYDKNRGTIRITNKNIESPMRGHNWVYMPSDTDITVFPTQSIDEVVEIMSTTMHWY